MAKKLDSVQGSYTMHDTFILDGWKRNEKKNWNNNKKGGKKKQPKKYKYKLAVLVHHVRKKSSKAQKP